MTKMSTSSSKCGTCKRFVNDGDKSGIAFDNCYVWYHGACASLSEEDVTKMGKIKGCLWLCDSCLNVFNSEATYNPVIDTKTQKCMQSIQNSLTGIKTTLRPTQEPVKYQIVSFQEYDYWGSRGGPQIFSPQRRMVHNLGSSSLSRVIEKFDYNSKRNLKKAITAIPGLSFNQNNKNDLKVIPTSLSKARLSKISKKENLSSGKTLSTNPSPDTLQTSTPH